ncbi:hypothetical protein ACN4EK_04520 [Pantanalinema rosaneae CENA516]
MPSLRDQLARSRAAKDTKIGDRACSGHQRWFGITTENDADRDR